MQRKHYNAIAAALYSGGASEKLISKIAKELQKENNKFDTVKFTNKAINGPSMEKRAKQYRAQLKRYQSWQTQ